MKKRVLIAIALLLVASVASAATTIRGKVVAPDGTTPYPDAEVTVESLNKIVYTDRDGEFYVQGVAPGQYTIRVKTSRSDTKHAVTALAQPVTDVKIAVK